MHSLPVHGNLIVPKWPYQVYVRVSCFFGGGNLLPVLLIPCATMWSVLVVCDLKVVPHWANSGHLKVHFFFYVCARKKGSNHRKSFLRLRRLRWWNAPRAKLDRKDMFWPGEARACDLAFYISDWLLSAITWDWILFCQMTWHDCRWTTLVDSGFLRKGSQDNSGFHKGNLFCQIGYLEYCSYMPRETHKPKVFAEITDAWVSIVSVSPAGEQQQRQQKQN